MDVEADDNNEDGDETAASPSEAFLSLQKELEEKEIIQKENEERIQNEHVVAAEAAKSLRRKVGPGIFGPCSDKTHSRTLACDLQSCSGSTSRNTARPTAVYL